MDKQVFVPCERELLSIIETQTLTYDQIVRESLYNPQTIDKVLHDLERKGQVKRIQINQPLNHLWYRLTKIYIVFQIN
jgi:DNA-binding HxlR family transcriptional regulator